MVDVFLKFFCYLLIFRYAFPILVCTTMCMYTLSILFSNKFSKSKFNYIRICYKFLHRTSVTVEYETSPNSSALQWLEPEQTAGKKQPYLFSQCQVTWFISVNKITIWFIIMILYNHDIICDTYGILLVSGHPCSEHGAVPGLARREDALLCSGKD